MLKLITNTFLLLLIWIGFPAAWITHIVVSIQAQEWLFMIVGALIAPVAIFHGFATWLGYNWF